MDNGVTTGDEVDEIVVEQIRLKQLDSGWRRGGRDPSGDTTNAVAAGKQSREQQAAEDTGGPSDEHLHLKNRVFAKAILGASS
jgi:hypothetical protein